MDAVIVGAGHAGLAASHQLAGRGVEHVVLERDRIGGSWLGQRWDSFTLNTPSWMNRLPGEGDGELAEPLDGFIGHGELVDRLERYARDWELPVREGVEVARIEQVDTTGRFRVHTSGDAEPFIDCRSVVVASGIQNVPRIPPVSEALPRSVLQLAALEYRRAADLPPGTILVVGAGQTGGQLVEDLLAAGREVYWSVSAVARIPRRYRGRDILEWLDDAGFFEAPTESITDPAELRATMPIISGLGRHGHTLSLQWLAARGARLIGRITDVHGSVLMLDDTVEACIRFADARSAEACAQIDKGILAAGAELPPLEEDEADRPFSGFDGLRTPDQLELERAGISTVIWATGVTGDFGYLPEGATADGQPRHTRGESEVEGIDFIGLPWLTRRSSGIIAGIVKDAELVGARVAHRIDA